MSGGVLNKSMQSQLDHGLKSNTMTDIASVGVLLCVLSYRYRSVVFVFLVFWRFFSWLMSSLSYNNCLSPFE